MSVTETSCSRSTHHLLVDQWAVHELLSQYQSQNWYPYRSLVFAGPPQVKYWELKTSELVSTWLVGSSRPVIHLRPVRGLLMKSGQLVSC